VPTIDDFIRPKEWVSDFVCDLGRVIRKWGEERYLPIRQQVDEDWKEHSIVADMLSEVATLIESTSAWLWTHVREITRPDIYGWDPMGMQESSTSRSTGGIRRSSGFGWEEKH